MTQDRDHLAILREGTETWNRWRVANQSTRPQLSGADLSESDLAGIDLSDADLSEAELCDARLAGANLKMADMAGADLSGAGLSGTSLYKCRLTGASLIGADLSGTDLGAAELERADLRGTLLKGSNLAEAKLRSANLSEANLSGANLNDADITGSSFNFATLASANVTGLIYGSFRSMRGRYHGIKGLESCYGNALFVRDAQDQDYLDSLEYRIAETRLPLLRGWQSFWFSLWGLIDYGRSLVKPAGYALLVAAMFGLVYLMDMRLGWGLMDYSSSAESSFTPFYYSVVTFTTLGFGDITPKHWVGELLIITEVVLGYTTLGLLLSILANKVARRS